MKVRLGGCVWVCLAAWLAACGQEDGERCDPGPVMEPSAWTPATPEDDPFAQEGDPAACPAEGYGPEMLGPEPTFEIRTGTCDPLTVEQPAMRSRGGCGGLMLRLWHYALFSAGGERAEGRLGLSIGQEVVWEKVLTIPRPSGLVYERVEVEPFEEGAPLRFHVRNHGANTYELIEMSLVP